MDSRVHLGANSGLGQEETNEPTIPPCSADLDRRFCDRNRFRHNLLHRRQWIGLEQWNGEDQPLAARAGDASLHRNLRFDDAKGWRSIYLPGRRLLALRGGYTLGRWNLELELEWEFIKRHLYWRR